MKNATVVTKDKVISYDDSFTNQYNVPVPVNNLLHTDNLRKTHKIWDTINSIDKSHDIAKEETQKNFEKLNDLSKDSKKKKESISTCKKCGGSGHFTFECMNNIDLGSVKSKIDDLNTLIDSDSEKKPKKKKDKKDKKDKKHKEKRDREEKLQAKLDVSKKVKL